MATLACLLEVAAPKPGNVHRSVDFDDMTLRDMMTSAVAIGPPMAAAPETGIGRTVLRAVQATRSAVGKNTNLGAILLLAPLAAVAPAVQLESGVKDALGHLDSEDARLVYEAIRLAAPGGLGRTVRFDVYSDPPLNLLDAMALAARHDLVARQYVSEYAEVFELVVPWLQADYRRGFGLDDSIVHTQMRLLARFPDSLIGRKLGPAVSREATERAAAVLKAGHPGDTAYEAALADFDTWLRGDGHRRNPGTTADLITAGLYVVIREQIIVPPFH
jgi:triphosphoribosyl-dephospho-CoA synthase